MTQRETQRLSEPLRMMKRLWVGAAVLVLGACGGEQRTPGDMKAGETSGGEQLTLTGAGATFPMPIYSKWFSEYAKTNPVRVNYASVGSGAGIRQITEGTVDFGASDAPMSDEELAKKPGILHVPTVMGAVAVTYNVPGLTQPLRLDGATLAAVYMGVVKKWNDPRIAALNPGVALPNTDILPVYRTDGSGTTYVFTDYLSAVSPEWLQAVGKGKSVQWPAGLGAKGNEGVTGQVRQSPGSIGYVELAYALENQLPAAALRNASGAFVQPNTASTSAAASTMDEAITQHPDLRLSVVNALGADAYPIASLTYLLIPGQIEDCARANALTTLVRWALNDGAAMATELHYAALPDGLRTQALAKLATVTCGANRQATTGS
jgi:phosphate transport system substrate-binding protein